MKDLNIITPATPNRFIEEKHEKYSNFLIFVNQKNEEEKYYIQGIKIAMLAAKANKLEKYEKEKELIKEARKCIEKAIRIKCEKQQQGKLEYKIGYKFKPINKDTIDMLIKEKIYFSDVSSLNDPLECPILKLYDKYFKNEIFQGDYEPYICSFVVDTKNKPDDIIKNTLLFSHYADRHRGICIEYEIDEKLLNQGKIWHTRVEYSENTPYKQLDNIAYVFAIKSKKWEYEEEYRFILFGHDKEKQQKRGTGVYINGINGGAVVKRIIFGLETPEEDKELLYTLLSDEKKDEKEKDKNKNEIQFFETKNDIENEYFTLYIDIDSPYKPKS